jgi:hypothetical protein
VKTSLPRNYSRDEFERLSHTEKLQYLTDLLDALAPPPGQPARQTMRAEAATPSFPKPSEQAAD